jgi:hypothetical protein
MRASPTPKHILERFYKSHLRPEASPKRAPDAAPSVLGDDIMSPAPLSLDSFKCRKSLKVGAKTYEYFSLPDAE